MRLAATRRSSPCRRRGSRNAISTSKNYTDLQEMTWRRIEHFFVHYKDLEPGKWAKIAGGATPPTRAR